MTGPATRWQDTGLAAAGVLILIAGWEAIARSGVVSPAVFPAPTVALATAFERVGPAGLAAHTAVSLQRIVIGFAIGALLAIALAVAGAWYRGVGNLVRPFVELLRPIPPLAWIPMAIVWFGLGEPSKIFLIVLGAFFPVLTNTWKGIESVDPVLLRAAQTMDLAGPALLARVALPAALPDIATGLRVGWGLAFGVLVAAELIAAESGLGFMIMNARQLGETGIIISGILMIGAVNLVTDWGIGALIRRTLGRWHAV